MYEGSFVMGSAEIKSNELSNRNVVISNYVARSAQTLSLSEKRILMAGIAQLGGVNAEVVLSAQEYADTYGVDVHTAYDQLKAAAGALMKRTLSWQIQDGKKIGVQHTIWVQGYRYFKDQGIVKFKFSEYIFPSCLNFRENLQNINLSRLPHCGQFLLAVA